MAALSHHPISVQFSEDEIYLFESFHASHFSMEFTSYPFHKICLILDGKGFLDTREKSIALKGKDILFLSSGTEHRFRDLKGYPISLIMICFFEELFRKSICEQEIYDQFFISCPTYKKLNFRESFRYTTFLKGMRNMIFEQTHQAKGYQILIRSKFLELIILMMRTIQEKNLSHEKKQPLQNLLSTIRYLDEFFLEPIKIDDLARMAHMSYRSYTQHFKKQTGLTVNQYMTNLRISYSIKRLRESRQILYAAMESGFQDLSHFYRAFKKCTGSTPKKYLESMI